MTRDSMDQVNIRRLAISRQACHSERALFVVLLPFYVSHNFACATATAGKSVHFIQDSLQLVCRIDLCRLPTGLLRHRRQRFRQQ